MRAAVRDDQNTKYENFIISTCILRTVLLGVSLWQGPFFSVGNIALYGTLIPFINVLNLFQMVFMMNVLQTKNIFQFKLYIPIVLYVLVVVALMIQETFRQSVFPGKGRLAVARAFLIAYAMELVAEIALCLFLHRRLEAEFLWTAFKRIGASTETNSKLAYL
jgi:hypothetical protein